MKMSHYFILFLILLISQKVNAGSSSLTLNQSSQDKNTSSKGALFQYTNPEEGKDSYSIDAALAYSYRPGVENREFGFAVEGHKNNLTDKEQDTLQIKGIGFITLSKSDCSTAGGVSTCLDFVNTNISIEHKTNNIDNSKSIQVVNEYYMKNTDWLLFSKPKDGWIRFDPKIGWEYENTIDSDDGKEGDTARLYGYFSASITPFPKHEDLKKISFDWNYSYWHVLNKDKKLEIDVDSFLSSKISANYEILKTDSGIEVTLTFTKFRGSNPRTDLVNQKYSQLGLTVKGDLNFD